MPLANDAQALADNPSEFFKDSFTAMCSLPLEEMRALQLSALRHRFASLKDKIPMLSKLANQQGIAQLDTIEDVIPLLFEHSMYKSYPRMFLENYDFTKINTWLNKLTAHDLSSIDVSDCQSIDAWLGRMEVETQLRITHSSGTTGTMSFLPHDAEEYDTLGRTMAMCWLQNFGEEKADGKPYQVIFPFYRSGYSSQIRGNAQYIKWLAKGEENFHTPFDGAMSSDVLYLAARIRFAQAKGTLGRLEISDDLLARKEEFEQQQAAAPAILEAFYERLLGHLKGQRIFTIGTWNLLLDLAQKGLANGQEGLFAPDSVVLSGGGGKGMTPPDNWQEDIARFIGVPRIGMNYAMSEAMGFHKMCSEGRYHLVPWMIPFILDPETSQPMPRSGVVTGRAAFFDLIARNHWGGVITGDEITIDWDSRCACGQEGHHVADSIQRFSDKSGDDDKITCAAQPQAHAEAMAFLASYKSAAVP